MEAYGNEGPIQGKIGMEPPRCSGDPAADTFAAGATHCYARNGYSHLLCFTMSNPCFGVATYASKSLLLHIRRRQRYLSRRVARRAK